MIKKILIGIFITAISCGYLFIWSPSNENIRTHGETLEVVILNVGQGDAIFVRTPKGHTMLIDGGPHAKVVNELQDVMGFFEDHIDYVVSTHPDSDHLTGIMSVLGSYTIGEIIISGITSRTELSKNFMRAIEKNGVPVRLGYSEADVTLDEDVIFDIIYPLAPMVRTIDKTNNYGIVGKLRYGASSVLLTADVEAPAEESIVRHGDDLHATVLKVGHHGSKTSSGPTFLDRINPQFCAISVGKKNRYHHPNPTVYERLTKKCGQIHRTDEDGRIYYNLTKAGTVSVSTR